MVSTRSKGEDIVPDNHASAGSPYTSPTSHSLAAKSKKPPASMKQPSSLAMNTTTPTKVRYCEAPEGVLKDVVWTPTILPHATKEPINDRVDVVFSATGRCSTKYFGNGRYLKSVCDHANALFALKCDEKKNSDKVIGADMIHKSAKQIVKEARDGKGKFLIMQPKATNTIKKRGSEEKETSRQLLEMGDAAAINKTMKELNTALYRLRNRKEGDSPTKEGNPPKQKKVPSPSFLTTEERRYYLEQLTSPGREKVGNLMALPVWDIASAVKLINIPDFKMEVRANPNESVPKNDFAGFSEKKQDKTGRRQAGKQKGSAAKGSPSSDTTLPSPEQFSPVGQPDRELGMPDQAMSMSPSYPPTPTYTRHNPSLLESHGGFASQVDTVEDPVLSTMLPSCPTNTMLAGPTPTFALQQLEADNFVQNKSLGIPEEAKTKRASCPPKFMETESTPTLQQLLQGDLFANDIATPGTLNLQPESVDQVAHGELKPPAGVAWRKKKSRSSCPPVFAQRSEVASAQKRRKSTHAHGRIAAMSINPWGEQMDLSSPVAIMPRTTPDQSNNPSRGATSDDLSCIVRLFDDNSAML